MSSTQAASHGAGQMRPVNSGKLLVASAMRLASRQRPRNTASFQSGIRFPRGQPEWQNGMPQSMQRAPCSWMASPACGSWYSKKSFKRSGIGRLRGSTRWITRKPPSLPMAREHLLGTLGLGAGLLPPVAARLAGGLAGPLGRDRRVLVLARLAGARGAVVGVARHVLPGLARLDR